MAASVNWYHFPHMDPKKSLVHPIPLTTKVSLPKPQFYKCLCGGVPDTLFGAKISLGGIYGPVLH